MRSIVSEPPDENYVYADNFTVLEHVKNLLYRFTCRIRDPTTTPPSTAASTPASTSASTPPNTAASTPPRTSPSTPASTPPNTPPSTPASTPTSTPPRTPPSTLSPVYNGAY